MRRPQCFALLSCLFAVALQAQDQNARIEEMEKKLREASQAAAALQRTIDALAAELASMRSVGKSVAAAAVPAGAPPSDGSAKDDFRDQILVPGLGGDESSNRLNGRPALFIQSRYQAFPLRGTNVLTAPANFELTRMESRWSGAVSDKVGLGFEIQFQPAPQGTPEQIVNDAFVEYYPYAFLTLRTGQFVKPFGFDIQHSSSARESPERGIFAGYFFPGERDRGFMIAADLDSLGHRWEGTQVFAGVFNGNRFFSDNNRQVNYDLRVRKMFQGVSLAVGVSAQVGHQLLPPGVRGGDGENLYGADVQWAWRRLGLRAEVVGGDMPSTLLSLIPVFAPAFRPGAHAVGGSAFSAFSLTDRDEVYARYDQFNRDLVSGLNIRAFNFGYFRHIGDRSRIGVDYQFKNHPSFNDDFLNTKFQIIWNVTY